MTSIYSNMTYAERVKRTAVVDRSEGDNQDVANNLREYVKGIRIQETLRARS